MDYQEYSGGSSDLERQQESDEQADGRYHLFESDTVVFKVCGLNPLKRMGIEAADPRDAAIIYARGTQTYGNIFVKSPEGSYFRFKIHPEREKFILDI